MLVLLNRTYSPVLTSTADNVKFLLNPFTNIGSLLYSKCTEWQVSCPKYLVWSKQLQPWVRATFLKMSFERVFTFISDIYSVHFTKSLGSKAEMAAVFIAPADTPVT